MKIIRLIASSLIILIVQNLYASSVSVYSTGAAKTTTNLCALRDNYGFLWVGTTKGLACFDGNGNPINGTHSGILRSTSNMRVTNIYEIGNEIWFTTPYSLMKQDRSKKISYRLPVKTKYGVEISSQVSNICSGPDNTDEIWIATHGQGLFRYNTKTEELTQDSGHGSFFTDVTLGNDGLIYAADIEGKIHSFKPSGEFKQTFTIPDYKATKAIINLSASDNLLWVSSASDLYCLDIRTGKISHKANTPDLSIISTITNYKNGTPLIGTSTGVYEYDIKSNAIMQVSVEDIDTNNKSLNVRINHLSKDPYGGILAVRQTGDVIDLFPNEGNFQFIPISLKYDANNTVNALAVDSRRNGIWIGSDHGIFYYDLDSRTLEPTNVTDLSNEPISSLTSDGKNVWIGTAHSGLFLYNNNTGKFKYFKNDEDTPYSLLSDEINDVFITTSGVTYVFTRWGICRYNPNTDEFNIHPEVGQQTEVINMAEYYDGTLWATTVSDGLIYLEPGESRFKSFHSDNLNNLNVTNLLMSKSGTLWAATQSDGLYYFDNATHDFLPYKLSLLDNRSISALQEDNDSNLWIVTDDTFIRIARDGKIDSNYSHLLPRTTIEQPFVLLKNGELALGTTNGILIFNSSLVSPNKNVNTYPTNISFPFDNEGEETAAKLGLNLLLFTTDKITLPYDHNSFTLHLAANHPADIPTVNYDYMLEGIDKDWNIGSTQSEVTYNNLSPGTYRFLVRPSGLSDVDAKALIIKVSPPWYMTIWAFIGYFILLLLLAWGIWHVIKARIRRHYTQRLESLKIQREREAWESKMRFFVDLVHEIRTPLMLISVPMEQLLKRFKSISAKTDKQIAKADLDDELDFSRKYLGSMQTNLDYLLGITNELLDFRKVDNGNETNLYLKPCNLNQLIEELAGRFEQPMQTEGKRLVIETPPDPVIADIDKSKTDRVLMNLLGNARKYCKSKTEIVLTQENDKAVITISDDGPGIPENERQHVFDLYYQIKDEVLAASLGTGLGLAYARLIAESHDGDITVAESPAGGAMFTLRIPLKAAIAISASAEANSSQEKSTYPDQMVEPDENLIEEAIDKDNVLSNQTTVLVVDDNRELLEMISDGLSEKYKVITAIDGIDALDKLKDNEVDFIVSDVMMPRMNGMEFLQRVKEDINTSHIPFIILTAKTTRESREEGMENGADIYLDKPFSIRALILQIENMRRTRQYFYQRRLGSEPMSKVDEEEKKAEESHKLPPIGKFDRELLEKMDNLMAENISDDEFSIENLAESLNMSRSSFYRKVKALKGMTPVDYMKNFRLDAAAAQLRERVRVNEVVMNVGFTSPSYFAKCFKEKYGVLPRDYVTSLQESQL